MAACGPAAGQPIGLCQGGGSALVSSAEQQVAVNAVNWIKIRQLSEK